MSDPKKLSGIDEAYVHAIKRNGGVVRVENGIGFLEYDSFRSGEVSKYRMSRLVALGAIEPNKDALFDGAEPQTYGLKSCVQ